MKFLALLLVGALSDGGLIPDGGLDGGSTPEVTLGQDYGCVEAPPPVVLDGGVILLSPRRGQRLDCELVGCQVERNALRDAGSVSSGSIWVPAVSSLITGLVTLYFTNRVARKEPLLP